MSVSKELFVLHSSKPRAAVDKDFKSDLRRLTGAPGRAMAGAPGRLMTGATSRQMAGGNAMSIEEKCCPANNPVVRKLFYPNALSIRFPDDNRVPTVNVDFSSFSTLKVGTDIPPSPYFLFLPSHNQGYFCVGSLVTKGRTRFLPHTKLPSSRDLNNYTYARNLASRIGIRSGTVSSTNMALSGTFNACAFYSLRDFLAFDVSEFSTRCITSCDYVQGVRSDNGVVLISGPESVPTLRPIITTELYSNSDSLNLLTSNEVEFTTTWKTILIYDYFKETSDLAGPIMGDRIITFFLDCEGSLGTASAVKVYGFELRFTYSKVSTAGVIEDLVVKHEYHLPSSLSDKSISLTATFTIQPLTTIQWVTKIEFFYLGPSSGDFSRMRTRLNVPMQFSLGNLGPGFIVACIGFNKDQEIVTDIARSIEAVPSGNLLPDKKADMTAFVDTEFRHIERAIIGFNSPGISTRRVYTRLDFFNFTMGNCGSKTPGSGAGADLGNFNTEDRVMAGPISSLVNTLSPLLNFIPGIGPIAAGIGGVVGNVAGSLGFCGEDPNLCQELSIYNPNVLDPSDSSYPSDNLTLARFCNPIVECYSDEEFNEAPMELSSDSSDCEIIEEEKKSWRDSNRRKGSPLRSESSVWKAKRARRVARDFNAGRSRSSGASCSWVPLLPKPSKKGFDTSSSCDTTRCEGERCLHNWYGSVNFPTSKIGPMVRLIKPRESFV